MHTDTFAVEAQNEILNAVNAIISAAAAHLEAILRRKDGLFILAAFMQQFVATNAPREPRQSLPDLFSS